MFTAHIIKKDRNDETIVYTVEYKSETAKIKRQYTFLLEDQHATQVRSKVIKKLNTLNTEDEAEIGPVEEVEKTTDEQEQQAWHEEVLEYEHMVHLKELGILTGEENFFVNKKDKVIKGFKPRYVK